MSGAHEKNHDYHIIDPSPWPIVASVGAFIMAVGAVLAMHYEMNSVFYVGLAIVLYGAYSWWADVIDEGEHQGDHTPIVQLGLRYGVFLFIISEVMFFVAWFWAFFNASIFPGEGIDFMWPPADIETLDPWHLPLVNTLLLLLSGATVTWAHHSIVEGDRKTFKLMLLFTVLLGATFTGVQIYEYSHATFGFDQNVYSSVFYMATGFHGFHVFIGTVFLLVALLRAMAGHFKPDHHFGFEAAAWYWHFVDVVWLVLFACIYIGGQ